MSLTPYQGSKIIYRINVPQLTKPIVFIDQNNNNNNVIEFFQARLNLIKMCI